MSHKLTILIPNYNRIKALSRLLESVFVSIERANASAECLVLVVDDFSSENISEITEKYKEKSNFSFKLQDKKCGNAETAFLNALTSVQSDHFWLLGNDDQVSAEGISEVLKLIDNDELGFILLNPRINKEKISKSFVPIHSTSPTVYYERGEDLFYDFGFVTSTTTFPCIIGKTKPVVNYHQQHDLNKVATVYSHTFTLFGALKDLPALFVTTPLVSFTLNERLEEHSKLLAQSPAGIAFYHQSLGLIRLIRETSRVSGCSIEDIGGALEDEVDKDTLRVYPTKLSYFAAFFFMEQLCREQHNILHPSGAFGHLVRSEVNEIIEVIEKFNDPDLERACGDAIAVFNWQGASAQWKLEFLRSAQSQIRTLAQKKYHQISEGASLRSPRKIALQSHVASSLRGIQAGHNGRPLHT